MAVARPSAAACRPRRRAPRRARARSRRCRRRAARRRGEARRAVGERPGERACPRELAARERRGERGRREPGRRRASSAARSTSSATGSKSMRWQRDRIVGSRSSALDVTSTTTVRGGGSSSVFSIALADSFWLPRSRSASNRISTLRSPSIGAALRLGQDRSRTSSLTRYDAPPGSNSTTSGCTPRCDEARGALVVADADRAAPRTRGRRPRRRNRAGPTSRYACDGRSAARAAALDRPLLADDVRSNIGAALRAVRAIGCDGRPDPVRRPRRACRCASTSTQPRSGASSRYAARTAAWNSAPARSNRSRVGRDPRLGDVVGEVEHDDDVGLEAAGRERARALDRVDAEPARDALVRERRRREAVAHDDRRPRERGADDARSTCCAPVREHQQRARSRASSASRRAAARRAAPRPRRCRPARTSTIDVAARRRASAARAVRPACSCRLPRRPRGR